MKRRKYDIVISNGSLGCMVDQALVLSEIWGSLDIGGYALISGIYWKARGGKIAKVDEINRWAKRRNFKFRLNIEGWCPKTEPDESFLSLHAVMYKDKEISLSLPLVPLDLVKTNSALPPILTYKLQV